MFWYLDTSVGLHAVLPDGDPAANTWIDTAWLRGDAVVSSTLLHLEVTRALRRDQRSINLADPLLDRVNLIKLQDETLTYAARIEPHVKSLDAIHLSVALLSGLAPTIATHDHNMADVARHLGLDATDPLDR